MPLSKQRLLDAYRQMHVIRKFEEAIRDLYMKGKIRGSFHPCVGQEALAVGANWAVRADDYMTCTYRGHGHALAKGVDVNAAMAEMLGKATGVCHGKGGSMHFTDPKVGLLGANAIVAGGVPHAAGAALAAQMQKSDTVSITFFGEGAVNQGVFLETLNLAVIWKLPVVFVCENNQYSEMTVSRETTSTPETWKRAESFGMPVNRIDGNDVEAVYIAVEEAAAHARKGGGPTYIEAMTYRLWGHMMGDPEVYRTKEEVQQAGKNEPIVRLADRLRGLGYLADQLVAMEKEAITIIAAALAFAESSPLPKATDAFIEVFAVPVSKNAETI
jgi:TPP-dependent pyruvate/acetoin dehydrogenase alpha subunit